MKIKKSNFLPQALYTDMAFVSNEVFDGPLKSGPHKNTMDGNQF